MNDQFPRNDLRKKLEKDAEASRKELTAWSQVGEELNALRDRVKALEETGLGDTIWQRVDTLEKLPDQVRAALDGVNAHGRRLTTLENGNNPAFTNLNVRLDFRERDCAALWEVMKDTRARMLGAKRLDTLERITAALVFVMLEQSDLGTRLLFALGEADVEERARMLVNTLFKTCEKQGGGC